MVLFCITDRDNLRLAARVRSKRAFRPGTVKNVRSIVVLYVAFTDLFGLKDFPADARNLTLFGEFLLRSFQAPSSVCNALANLRHFHLDVAMSTQAFDSRRVFLWKRALLATVRHVPVRAPPLPLVLLERLCELATKMGPLGQLFAALAAVLFFTMARLSSLLPAGTGSYDASRLPVWGDFRVAGVGHTLSIKWAKNMQSAGQGLQVPLARRPGSPACPVDNLRRLRKLLGSCGADTPIFVLPRTRCQPGRSETVLTMRVARSWLKLLLRRLGQGAGGYTFHSFRRGACSLAFDRGAASVFATSCSTAQGGRVPCLEFIE